MKNENKLVYNDMWLSNALFDIDNELTSEQPEHNEHLFSYICIDTS